MISEQMIPSDKEKQTQKLLWKYLRKVPQFTRNSRHLWSILAHSTPRKLFNLFLIELEYRLRRVHVKGQPYILIVDPLNVCNLRCPLCPTGTGDLGRKGQKMEWDTFTGIIDQLAPYAYEVNLHNWGESLLHPHIYEMIEYVSKKNIATNMSTNFNRVTEDKIDRLIKSGLEYLILSIDGITNENYVKYRVEGNLDQVLKNVRTLVKKKEELGSSTPFIEWQFIVFKHNAHEVEKARALAKELGINRFRVIPPGLPFDAPNQEQLRNDWFLPQTNQGSDSHAVRAALDSSCFYLYRSFTVNPDGKSAPCCIVYGTGNDFGNTINEGFSDIWNNSKYLSARSQFRNRGKVTVPTICDRCHLFKKKAHLNPDN